MDILLEQLAYGSFPFWDRGYDVLAKSPGCRAEWVADVLLACRQFGEAPAGVAPSPCLFALRLASGPWAVVGVEPQGEDDRGRPGALAFHALLVEARDYRRAGSNPFAFARAFRRDWSAGTSLDALFWTVEAPTSASPDPRTGRVVEALSSRRRVALESAGPVDGLASEVWASLPESVRRRASVATWSFGNANRFDLIALPRLAGVALDRSYVDPASIDAEPSPPADRPRSLPLYRAAAVAGLAVLVGVVLAWRWSGESPRSDATPARTTHPAGASIGPESKARIEAELASLAERFEVGGPERPGVLMARIANEARYRGPRLSDSELARLSAEFDPDRVRALEWHERLKTFADDRPLPDDFDRLPLERQLDRLGWSFHLDPSTRPEAVPGVLLKTLSRDGPVRPTPLASRYPALSDYARFLARLPRP